MTKKHFIALADSIRNSGKFTSEQISVLADFLATQNPLFNRQKWIDYINRK